MTVSTEFQLSPSGRLIPATWIPSPNYNNRPVECAIDLLVIHNISVPAGEFGGSGIIELFTNTIDPNAYADFPEVLNKQVSAHLLIRRDGQVIQFVEFNQRAWHAGISSFEGREACNDFSIGIELEGTDSLPFTDIQYDALIGVTQALMAHYPGITVDRITGHSDIAPGRKTDPGAAFDWLRFKNSLKQE